MQTKWFFPAGLLVAVLLLNAGCGPVADPNAVSGTIETDEIHVASRYGGRVTGLFVQEGDALTNGQWIAELSAPELLPQRQQLAALLAEWQAGPRVQEVAATRQEWEAAQAELEFARADARREEELFASGMASAAERDRAVTRATAQEKTVAAARSRYDLLLAGTRPEKLAQVQAQLAEVDEHLKELRISAPTNCVLEVLNVKVGDVLPPNREAATLLLTDHLWVRVFVPELWLGRVKTGAPVTVRVDAFPGREFRGVVEQVGRAAEFTPRNVQTVAERVKQVFGVKIRLENAEGALRAGMSADVVFPAMAK